MGGRDLWFLSATTSLAPPHLHSSHERGVCFFCDQRHVFLHIPPVQSATKCQTRNLKPWDLDSLSLARAICVKEEASSHRPAFQFVLLKIAIKKREVWASSSPQSRTQITDDKLLGLGLLASAASDDSMMRTLTCQRVDERRSYHSQSLGLTNCHCQLSGVIHSPPNHRDCPRQEVKERRMKLARSAAAL